jgi:hypothetical protein
MVSGSQVLTRTMQKQSSNKHTVVRAWGHLFGDVRYKLKWKMAWEWKPHELGFKAKFAALGCPTVFMEAFRSSLDLVTLDLVADPVFEALFGEHCALRLTSLEFPMLWQYNRQHTALPFPPSGVYAFTFVNMHIWCLLVYCHCSSFSMSTLVTWHELEAPAKEKAKKKKMKAHTSTC